MNRLTLLALLLVLPVSAAAQDWSRYKAGSLPAIMADHEQELTSEGSPGKPHWLLSADDFPTFSRLLYTGEHRPLTAERRGLLEHWQLAFGVNPAVRDAFTNEYAFKADTATIWLAVQTQLEESLAQPGRTGTVMTVLTTFIGGHYDGEAVTWLFLVNAIDTSPE